MRRLTLLLDYAMGQGPLHFRLESLYEHTFFCYFCSELLLLLDRYIPSALSLTWPRAEFIGPACFRPFAFRSS
jgi:hypothetical protein